MMRRVTKAGGFFLTVCILAGLVVGVVIRNPMIGVLGGTVIGVSLALLTWLLDRRST